MQGIKCECGNSNCNVIMYPAPEESSFTMEGPNKYQITMMYLKPVSALKIMWAMTITIKCYYFGPRG